MYRPVGYRCSCCLLQLWSILLLVLGIGNLQNGVSLPFPGTGEKFMARALVISLASSAHLCWEKCPLWGENARHRVAIIESHPSAAGETRLKRLCLYACKPWADVFRGSFCCRKVQGCTHLDVLGHMKCTSGSAVLLVKNSDLLQIILVSLGGCLEFPESVWSNAEGCLWGNAAVSGGGTVTAFKGHVGNPPQCPSSCG